MTQDNFAQPMYEYMECAGTVAALYFVILFMLLEYVLLYLYLAIFIENFQLTDEDFLDTVRHLLYLGLHRDSLRIHQALEICRTVFSKFNNSLP